MGLFSDLDWIIILGVGAVLLFGHGAGTMMRQLGRWYGRALRLKQELVSELARTADLPTPQGPNAGSLRAVLLGPDWTDGSRTPAPAAVLNPPMPPPVPGSTAPLPWTGGYPVTTWSVTFFASDRPQGEPR